MTVNLNAIKKQNDDIIQNSFNTSFYNDALQNLTDMAEQYKENPAEMDMQSSAFIDGVVSDLPEKDAEKIKATLDNIKTENVSQSKEEFDNRNLVEAENTNQNNIVVARDIATKTAEKQFPQKVQIAASANYIKNVKDSNLSDRHKIALIQNFGKNLIINHLGDILRDKTGKVEYKMKWINSFIDGKTGDPAIDNMSPYERSDAVLKAMGVQQNIDRMQEHLMEMETAQRSGNWNQIYVSAANMIAGGNIEGAMQLQKHLMSTATNKEQFDNANDIFSAVDVKTVPFAKQALEQGMTEGTLTKEVLDEFVNNRWIGYADYEAYRKIVESPLAQNKKQDRIQVALSQAKKVYGYTAFGKNDGYDAFVANLDAQLATELMNQNELQDAVEKSFEKTDKLYPHTKQQTVQDIEKFAEKYSISYETVSNDINKILTENLKSEKRTVKSAKQEDVEKAKLQYASDWMKRTGASRDEANLFLHNYNRIISGGNE